MSSNTQYDFEPVVTREVRIKGEQAVSLDRLLGIGGRKLLSKTLKSLPEIRNTVMEGGEVLANMDMRWQKVESDAPQESVASYQLLLQEYALPQELIVHGVQKVCVELQLGTHIAELRHTCQFRTTDSSIETVQQEVQQTANRLVNQSFNKLLTVAIASRVQEQVKQYVGQRLKQQVEMRVTPQFNVQTFAFVKDWI